MKKTVLRLFNRYNVFLRYSIIGGTGASLDFIVFFLLNEFIGMTYIYANIISVGCGITNNFILNSIYNFKLQEC